MFVANVCIAILIAWSEHVVKQSVNVVMLQNFVVLVCTAISMARRDLSVSDAHFALTLTISPLSIYFVYSTFRFVRKRPNHLYACLGSAKVITAIMSTILLVWWTVFDLLIYFSDVYKDSNCRATLRGWILYKTLSSFINLIFALVLIPLIPLFWIIYFIRHFKDIREEYRRHMKKTDLWERFQWVQLLGRGIKSFMIAQWDVITRSHKWLFFLNILVFYVTWAGSLLIWVVDVEDFFYEVVVTTFDPDAPPPKDDGFDPLGYGQLLSVAIAIEPVWAVLKLTFFRRYDILSWVKQWPQSVWNGIVFIFTGHRNPWKKISEMQRMHSESDGGADYTYNHLFHPHVLEFNELPILTKESIYEESLMEPASAGEGAKARVMFSRAASPQLVTTYFDPYSEVLEDGHGHYRRSKTSSFDSV
ncbi:hypothetical protein E1B28_006785 [Marasmius oreades]|nr:uncharacterized protein E1B28_006785 [Marasmius oreades]KAG7096111.1 hypothetical protein E1B28_006785 [Marasmius oreades]